jgi:hypothetical protein
MGGHGCVKSTASNAAAGRARDLTQPPPGASEAAPNELMNGGSMARIGVTTSAEARERMRASHTGLKHTPETRAKIGATGAHRRQTSNHDPDPAAPSDELTDDMRPGDLVYVLENLSFQGRDHLGMLRIDRQVRDYLVDALRRRPQSS